MRSTGLMLVLLLYACRDDAKTTSDAATDTMPSDVAHVAPADVTDATPADVADATPADATPADVADIAPADATPVDAGPVMCGSVTCGAGQYCLVRCSGFDAGPSWSPYLCVDIPPSCSATPTCACLRPCGTLSGGSVCREDSARRLSCDLCV